jgi:hypothetical protein
MENGQLLRKVTIFLAIVLTVSAIAPVWFVSYPPLTDYAKHLLLAKVMSEFNDPVFPYSRFFELHRFPIPNLIFQLGIIALLPIFNILTAGKIVLSLSMILFAFSIFYFLNCVAKEKMIFGLFGLTFIYNWYFNLGLVNFYIGLGLFFVTLGYWWKEQNTCSISNSVTLLFLFLLLYISHVFAYAAGVFAIGILSAMSFVRIKEILKKAAPLIPSLLLFFGYLYISTTAPGAKQSPGFSNLPDLIIQFVTSFLYFSRVELFLYILPLACYLFFFACMLIEKKPIRLNHGNLVFDFTTMEGKFFMLCTLFFVLYLILPWHGFGGWGLNQRLTLITVFVGIATFSLPKRPIFVNGFLILVVISSLSFYIYNLTWYRKINREYMDFASGINYIEKNKTILPIILDKKGDSVRTEPFRGFWAYYHLERGGIGPYFFAMPSNHPVAYKEQVNNYFKGPELLPPEVANLDEKLQLEPYDYVLVWRGNEDIISKIKTSFKLIYKKGDLQIYRKGN